MDRKSALRLRNARGGVREIGRVRRRDFVTVFVPTVSGAMIQRTSGAGVYEFGDRRRAQQFATRVARRARKTANDYLQKKR